MGIAPAETAYDPLRPPGAVMVQRDGLPVVGHYGSVATEIAVCTKAAGLVDRSNVRQLAISGAEALLDHVLAAAAPDGAPSPGRARCIAGTWCCRATARRAIVAGGPGAITRWRQVTSRAISTAGLAVTAELLADSAALSLVGPRSTRIMDAAGLLAGSPLNVVLEDGDHYLLLFEHGHPNAVWQALWDAGHDLGLAPVGNEALELLQAAHRPID